MKIINLVFISFVFIFCSCKKNSSCENTESEVKELMLTLYKKKITFPKNMKKIELNTSNSVKEKKTKYTIIHFFTADCDKCVNELKNIQNSLKEIPPNRNVSYMFISSAPTDYYILEAIKKVDFKYPIFYEKDYYSFKTINKLSITDDLYNTMIINDKNEVILFGAFYDNKRAQELFSKILVCDL